MEPANQNRKFCLSRYLISNFYLCFYHGFIYFYLACSPGSLTKWWRDGPWPPADRENSNNPITAQHFLELAMLRNIFFYFFFFSIFLVTFSFFFSTLLVSFFFLICLIYIFLHFYFQLPSFFSSFHFFLYLFIFYFLLYKSDSSKMWDNRNMKDSVASH